MPVDLIESFLGKRGMAQLAGGMGEGEGEGEGEGGAMQDLPVDLLVMLPDR